MPGMTAGSFDTLGAALLMWSAMMAVMMLPATAPTLALYHRAQPGAPAAAARTAGFAVGYLAVWTGFSAAAAALQVWLRHASLLSPSLAPARAWLAGVLLVAAGAYQLTAWKRACLSHCQSPLAFLMTHWRPRIRGALVMGLTHGVFCTGCCWALMLLLFAFGVMDARWIAALAAYVLIEKHLWRGPLLPRLSGVALLGAGTWLLARPLL